MKHTKKSIPPELRDRIFTDCRKILAEKRLHHERKQVQNHQRNLVLSGIGNSVRQISEKAFGRKTMIHGFQAACLCLVVASSYMMLKPEQNQNANKLAMRKQVVFRPVIEASTQPKEDIFADATPVARRYQRPLRLKKKGRFSPPARQKQRSSIYHYTSYGDEYDNY